jgi:hypothetical protein
MRKVWGLFLLLLLIGSCKKERKNEWDAEYLAPLAKATLTMADLVNDSLASVNPDNSLNLQIANTIYELDLASLLIQIPDTQIGQKINVDSLTLPQTYINYVSTMGAIAAQLKLSTDAGQQFLGSYLLGNHGNTANIPALNGFSTQPFVFDGSTYFQELEIASGSLDFWFVNHLPVPITNVAFEIRNQSSGNLIVSDNIPYIAAYDSAYRFYDLSGKTVDGNLLFSVTNFNSPGSNGVPVLIDTNDFIRIYGRIFDIKAKRAIARFPAQDLISSNEEVTQIIGERKFTYVQCETGQLEVNFKSSIQENVKLTYILKGAYDPNGNGIKAITNIPAAPAGQTQQVTQTYDLSGYSINLTGVDGTKFNTYTQLVIARIDSTGILREITSDDSVFIQYKIKNIKPKYIKGYAGRDTFNFSGSSPFDVTKLFSGNLPNAIDFQRAKLSVSIENGLGIDGIGKINFLSGTNQNGNQVNLIDNSASPIIGTNLTIDRAKDFPLRPAYQEFQVNSTNSNVKDFITNLPNKIDYDVQIKTNFLGNRQTYNDFAYLDSKLKVNINLTIPLDIKANNFNLRDTIDFKLGNTPNELDNIKDGTLFLITNNKFPLEAKINLIAYDANYQSLDTLLQNYELVPADVDQSCKAQIAKKNIMPIPMPTDRVRKLYTAQKLILTATFNTKSNNGNCSGQYFTIYYDYYLDAKVTAQFTYRQKL